MSKIPGITQAHLDKLSHLRNEIDYIKKDVDELNQYQLNKLKTNAVTCLLQKNLRGAWKELFDAQALAEMIREVEKGE